MVMVATPRQCRRRSNDVDSDGDDGCMKTGHKNTILVRGLNVPIPPFMRSSLRIASPMHHGRVHWREC